jgi:hypothetical protein
MNIMPDYPTAAEVGIPDANVFFYGNINLRNRPLSLLKNGKVDESFSFIINTTLQDGTLAKAVIPQVSDDGRKLTEKQAVDLYLQTNRHFGKFADLVTASKYRRVLQTREVEILKTERANSKSAGEEYFPVAENPDETKRNLSGIVQLSDLYGQAATYFGQNILEVNVDFQMDIGSEIAIKVLDPSYLMSENNYFVIRRDVTYRGLKYEIASVETGPGDGYSPVVTIRARNKGIMQMKRDKLPRTITSGGSAYEFAASAAAKFGMNFIGQKTNPVPTSFKAGGSNLNESTWDVLDRIAQDNQYVVFEFNNILVFGSHQWLMWKFGAWTKTVPGASGKPPVKKNFVPLLFIPGLTGSEIANFYIDTDVEDAAFEVEKWHTFNTDEADPLAATGSCNVLMPNGALLRPGMTALCGPYPNYFNGGYIITSVSFSEGSPNPASVQFRTPEEPKNQKGLPYKPRTANKPALPLAPFTNQNFVPQITGNV